MSSEADFIDRVARTLRTLRLDAIIVGNVGSILHGAPVLTHDLDLLIRDTPSNRKKLIAFAAALGGVEAKISDLADVHRILGAEVPIDVLFDKLPGGLSFNSIKGRSIAISTGLELARVASLQDIIRSKRAAGRKKDLAVLPILEDTLRVLKANAK